MAKQNTDTQQLPIIVHNGHGAIDAFVKCLV